MRRRPGSLPSRNKYLNQKTVIGGVTFDSKAEAARWLVLSAMQQDGQIADLRRQVVFTLVPSVKLLGAIRASPALRYTADFTYTVAATGERVVEDKKGMRTAVYRLKRHLMKALLGIDVLET